MATLSHANSKRKYSWWWDSHISPKNSKWLQENLTDMDSKVKQMIKLIEEDADSFARRAEMYYKKRPELMKMVEEFYRAYRALAERYDHATGVIRDAHQTMPEAFSNQIPMMDETEVEPHTPDVRHPSRSFLETDELQKDSSSNFPSMKRIGAHTEEPDSALNKRGFKPLIDHVITGEHVNGAKFDGGHARRGLNFIGTQESKGINNGSHDSRAGVLSERVTKAEKEILALKKSLAKLETEKEAGLLQYQQSLERLSNMELEVSHAREKSQGLDERASKAEAEVQSLKQALTVLQAEMEASLNQYQECLKKITNLEKNISFAQKDARELNERATRSESDVESLKQDLARVEAERDAALVQYKQCRESLSKMEQRLEEAEEKARRINEQADKAESEIEALKLEVAKVTEEKEDAAFRYEQCLEIISSVKQKLSCAEDEVRRLNSKVDDGDEKLHSSEQKCLQLETSNHTLQSELQSLAQKLGSQNVELSEKQRELNTLWISLQYERLRFIEAMAEDVGSTGLDPKCFGESVKQFQDDNSKLKEIFKADKSEKASLPEKLEIMEKLLEKNSVLENSLSNLNAEMESVRGKVKVLEETCQSLSCELHKGTNEVEQWETQAAPLHAELLISAVNETLFEGKVSELAYACENLESRNHSKEMEIELLKETVSKLEGENGKLHDHLAAYVPTVSALNDCITSLEMHTLVQARPHEYEEPKVQDLVNHQYTENGQQTGKDHTVMTLDALLNLEDMQRRISAIEMEVKQINFEPKDEIREAKQQHHGSINKFEVLPKDIMLDQISERSNGISMRRTLEADDQMFKSRETTDKDDTVEVDKTQVMAQKGATDEWENKYPASEFLVEKEFSVEKLENSRRLTQAHENRNKSNVLELLDSDAQKLIDLQITIQELMKVKVIETGKKGKYIEYDSVKDQLEAAQETIRKLFEAIHKLKKNMEEGRMPFDEKAAVESGEIGSVSRKRETEHAWRRMAEKLGWLQLDVKRRLSVLLKQGGVKDVKEKAEVADHHGPRVLLRDYFYGRNRNNKEKKRAKFCACMKPSTM